MFSFFKGKEDKLIQAIEQGDLNNLGQLLNKFEAVAINSPIKDGPCCIERAIRANQAKALGLILDKGGDAKRHTIADQPFCFLALEQADSLALLSALLKAGADVSKNYQQQSLLSYASEHCPAGQLMLHLSRLNQHGADISSEPHLISDALQQRDQPLIQFLINSGANLPTTLDEEQFDNEILQYAKRTQQDRDLRLQLFNR